MKNIIKGLLSISFSQFLVIEIFLYLIFILIDSYLFKNIEKLLEMKNKVYWYDIVTLVIFIILNVYIYYLIGLKFSK